jgi:transcriptional regulator with XRE-family HTH domain
MTLLRRVSGPKLKSCPKGKAIHPFVKFIAYQMTHNNVGLQKLAEKSGMGESTIRAWKNGNTAPKLMHVEAVLNSLGYSIEIRPKETQT